MGWADRLHAQTQEGAGAGQAVGLLHDRRYSPSLRMGRVLIAVWLGEWPASGMVNNASWMTVWSRPFGKNPLCSSGGPLHTK